jgi:pimeloyl-ACP methyl ester carboxylesterase
VTSGTRYASELLRRRVLSDIARADGTASEVGKLRAQLRDGGMVDLGGFPLTSRAYEEICSADLVERVSRFAGRCMLLGISRTPDPGSALKGLADHLRALGADVSLDTVQDPFAPDFGRFHHRTDATTGVKRDSQIGIRDAVRPRVVSWATSSLPADGPTDPGRTPSVGTEGDRDGFRPRSDGSPAGVREYPVFIPAEEAFLGAVVTVPPDEPTGLVVLLTGIGAPRSHRFQMWTRVARRLADRGIASIRLDYGGMGDSTGAALEWTEGWERVLSVQVLTATRQQMRILGVDRVAAVGNCGGAWLSLLLEAELGQSAAGAMCLLPGLMEATKLSGIYRKLRWSKLAEWTRSVRLLRRVIVRTLRRRRPEWRLNPAIPSLLGRTLNRGPVMFLYGDRDLEYSPRGAAALLRVVESFPVEHRERFQLRVLSDAELEGFDRLDVQELVVEASTEWLTACFEHRAADGASMDLLPSESLSTDRAAASP